MSTLLKDRTILVVEDDADTRDLLRFVLEESGAKVVAVASVDAAFGTYRQSPPHGVIADIRLGRSDGYALIKAIRETDVEYRGFTPVVAVTGFASVVDAAWLRDHLDEPDLVVGDVRGPNAHTRGHIPGSRPLVLGSPPPMSDRAMLEALAPEVVPEISQLSTTPLKDSMPPTTRSFTGATSLFDIALTSRRRIRSSFLTGVTPFR